MKLNMENSINYYKLGKIIENLSANFKGINLITTAPEALPLTFQENNKNFSPMYVNWGEINLFLYPDYNEKLNSYIIKNRPIIIMEQDKYISGYYEIYRFYSSWNESFGPPYSINIPLELKDKYLMLFQNKNSNNFYKLDKEQIESLETSLAQQIALCGKEKITFKYLFFDNLFKSIPESSKSDIWLNPLLERNISATDLIINSINSKNLKPILANYDDANFIKFLYLFMFDKEPDDISFKQWTNNLKNGMKREEVIKYFLNSEEWKKSCMDISLIP